MQIAALRALEFDRIVAAVRGLALTPMGEERLARLQPHSDAGKVAQFLAATSETAQFIVKNGSLPLRASTELPSILGSLAIEGRALEAPRLLALATFLDSIEETRAAIRRVAGMFPLVEQAATGASSFSREVGQVREKIDASGEVVDTASPELKLIRERLRKQKSRLRGTLESYLRGKETAKYLQEQVVTERNGRYVLVVRTEHRSGIPGIVHGASTSGASLYLEPLSTVEINNEIVALEEQEAEEIRRILLALTDAFRARAADVTRTIDAATDLDVLQSRARFSLKVGGSEPAIATDGTFELRGARHPLLVPGFETRESGFEESAERRIPNPESRIPAAPVPNDVLLIPPTRVMVITGPNTGGKTVALKTAGLLALMAQAGLHIPAEHGSRVPVFRCVFADIGDEQSISASLSTFSAHVANVVSMDRKLVLPAMVLLDEVGAGTDPVEGGALGIAVIDHFRKRGAHLIATTHYAALKSDASTK